MSIGVVYSSGYNGYEEVTSAENTRADRLLERHNTDVTITGTSFNTGEFTVQVLNEGSTTLSVNATDVILDGVYQSTWVSSNVSGSTTTDIWAPGETLNVTVSADSAPDRVKVVTGTGVSVTEVL